jgi:hypothetical protein
MLQQMLRSIADTSQDIGSIEVLVNFDNDDYESLSAIPILEMEFPFLKPRINEREINIHVNVNKMALDATGRYIWGLGDDCHIITKHWDKIAEEKFEKFFEDKPDRIAIGAVDSTSVDKCQKHEWYTDAPIATREGIDALGYLIHPHFISLGADVATYMVYSSVNRIIDMRDIVFDHVTHNTLEKVVNPDQTAFEYRERQYSRQPVLPWEYNYSDDIALIKSKIGMES